MAKNNTLPEGIKELRSNGAQRLENNYYAADVVSNQRPGYQNVLGLVRED